MGKTRVIPENILKKQKRDAALLKARQDRRAAEKTARAKTRKEQYSLAEKYFNEYQAADAALVKARRDAKAAGSFYVEAQPKVAFIIRIKGINKLAPKPKKILQLLRLRQLHNGVFVKLNKATWNMIRMIEPFVTFGYPSRETISKLIYKRGYGKVNRSRIPLTDNSIIADALGTKDKAGAVTGGITCIESLIHEIVTCGPDFKRANNFLWPFKLSSPLGGFELKRHSFAQGYGAYGDREDLINSLINKMM
jgi:large subunit ribosomal protein L7e